MMKMKRNLKDLVQWDLVLEWDLDLDPDLEWLLVLDLL